MTSRRKRIAHVTEIIEAIINLQTAVTPSFLEARNIPIAATIKNEAPSMPSKNI